LARKTSLTKKADQAGACDDPEGIPRGHTCILAATPAHPCLTGSVHLMCPGGSASIAQHSKLKVGCQVCGGITSQQGDIDSRVGRIEVEISWGPNILDGVVNEDVIKGYEIYAVTSCRERTGVALAKILPLQGTPSTSSIQTGKCCDTAMYKANVISQLPPGVTSQSFMVVPLTSIGPLDAGWVTPEIDDFAEGGQSNAAIPGKASSMQEQGQSQDYQSQKDQNQEEASTKKKKAVADSANGLKTMTTLFALAVSRACLLH